MKKDKNVLEQKPITKNEYEKQLKQQLKILNNTKYELEHNSELQKDEKVLKQKMKEFKKIEKTYTLLLDEYINKFSSKNN